MAVTDLVSNVGGSVAQLAADRLKQKQKAGPTAFEQREQAKQGYLQSLQGEVDVAAQGPAALEKAKQAAIAQQRMNTGRVLAQGRGLAGGGRGLALMGQLSQDRAVAESTIQGQYQQNIQEALARSAQARSEYQSELGKAAQQEMDRGTTAQGAADAAEKDWETAMANTTVFTDEDAAKARQALYDKAALEADPMVAAAIRKVADRRYAEETKW